MLSIFLGTHKFIWIQTCLFLFLLSIRILYFILVLQAGLTTWARSLHRKWSCSSRTLGDDMLAARCLMLNSYLIDRYFSVHLTTNIGIVKLSTNVVYGRNGLWAALRVRHTVWPRLYSLVYYRNRPLNLRLISVSQVVLNGQLSSFFLKHLNK